MGRLHGDLRRSRRQPLLPRSAARGVAIEISIRSAAQGDLLPIVRLLADDRLGAARERAEEPLPASYRAAFAAIDADPNHELVVAEHAGRVIGVLQISFLPHLTHRGGWRAHVEGVRVSSGARGAGVGERMLRFAIERARARGCHLVQLTTDKRRPDAIRFYERLGFAASHEGMKLPIEPAGG